MNVISKFMAGRSGGDPFSVFLFIASMVLSLAGRFSGFEMLISLSYVPLLFAVYRIFSKDVNKRRMENARFNEWIRPLVARFNQMKMRHSQKKYQHFRCLQCKTLLRVPTGKGKVMITCPKCKTKVLGQT